MTFDDIRIEIIELFIENSKRNPAFFPFFYSQRIFIPVFFSHDESLPPFALVMPVCIYARNTLGFSKNLKMEGMEKNFTFLSR